MVIHSTTMNYHINNINTAINQASSSLTQHFVQLLDESHCVIKYKTTLV